MPVDTPLHKACHSGDINEIKKVFEEHDPDEDPIDVNAAGAQDRRPLHRAAGGNHKDAVAFLIDEKQATVDQVPSYNDRRYFANDATDSDRPRMIANVPNVPVYVLLFFVTHALVS